ncbi:PTS cellobiose transporter subunit IIA [Lactobacillus gallinarum]|uniref:PTS cellobiose transporter subunit IIA n=1 Tax=Lactobacillus gallinarum TaxID=52242 RepID=UPI0024B0BDEE|nr:PTS cellobiose transporter subunit IIA [Lactobacillus gallinarum]MDM8276869.1 PTS cellobiose transporter subunit IIA [Lactobacillus gallinarum]
MNQKEVEREKAEVARTKHRESIKYMYFSRYLMIRYIVTIFLFCNLMWFIISAYYGSRFGIFAALIMGVYSAVASFEQLSKMHNRKRDIPITRIYLYVQMIVNALLTVGLFTPLKKMIFPFVINNDILYFMAAFLLIGIVLAALCEFRIHQILNDKDRYYRVIEVFKKHQQ